MKKILETLENAGFEAWAVGGYVRDKILGKNSEDIDIATNAKWQQVKEIFEDKNYKVIETGTKHGTVTVIKDHKKFEITTYRLDGGYSDSRHPDEVEFVNDIRTDLARRDFTMNAIAWHPERGYFDPFHGQLDIKNKTITTVGNPKERFSEDALRILRACRFSSQLDFRVNEETYLAILKCNKYLKRVSVERVRDELTKLLCGKNVKRILMSYKRVMCTCIPELSPLIGFDQKTKYHCYDIYEHTAVTVENIPTNKYTKEETEILKWAALLHDIGKPEKFFTDDSGQGHFYDHPKVSRRMAKGILKKFNFSKQFIKTTLVLIRWHDHPTQATKRSVRKMLRRLAEKSNNIEIDKLFMMLTDLRRADALAHAPEYRDYLKQIENIEYVIEEVLDDDIPITISELKINGDDLINLGIEPGPKIEDALNKILSFCINQEVKNNREDLIKFIQHKEDLLEA